MRLELIVLLGGGSNKVKTIYNYQGEGADDNNSYIKIDDIIVQNPEDLEEPMIGRIVTNTDFFNKCYDYIKEGYTFNAVIPGVNMVNMGIVYNHHAIIFSSYIEGDIISIIIKKNT